MNTNLNIAIIGAGLAGITLANRLSSLAHVQVFEKARGPSGRMSSKRTAKGYFDHGAQYFTTRSQAFKAHIEPFLKAGDVVEWKPRYGRLLSTGELTPNPIDENLYICAPQMTALNKRAASNLTLSNNTHIEGIVQNSDGKWTLIAKDGTHVSDMVFDWVISTAPAPQTESVLPWSDDQLGALKAVKMTGCFSLMLMASAWPLAFDAIRCEDEILSFICNQSARGRKTDQGEALLVHVDNKWAQAHLEADLDWVEQAILQRLKFRLGLEDVAFETVQLHRWRYAATPEPLGAPFLCDPAQKIAAAGDWCLGGRVEFAFSSANALADWFAVNLGG